MNDEDDQFTADAQMLDCLCEGGPLHGQWLRVPIEKHFHRDRKTGAEYQRSTTGVTGQLVSTFHLKTAFVPPPKADYP